MNHMPKIPDNKARLEVVVSKELKKALIELIYSKYKTVHRGVLSAEVESALWDWIHRHAHTHTENKANPIDHPSRHEKIIRIKQWLISHGFSYQFTDTAFKQAVVEALGYSDPRTIKKYLELGTRLGYWKKLNDKVYELL